MSRRREREKTRSLGALKKVEREAEPRPAPLRSPRITPARWQRVKSLFEQALDRSPSARSAFLEEADESPSVLAEVRELIVRDAQASGFLRECGPLDCSAAPRFSPGDLIHEHFRIVSVLGRGGMGIVYRAEDLTLARPVALKFLPAGQAGNPQALERLKREARAAAALNHPNICVVHEIGQHLEQPFIAMELLEGCTLRQRIGRKPLNILELLDWAAQIADGLEAAHLAGIVHRDIKPANIFVTTRGQPKILDFGLAKVTPPSARDAAQADVSSAADEDYLTTPGDAVGTVPYMSPEQARGEELDARTDLFSFGAVLYEMATGEQAFTGATHAIVHEAILGRTPPRTTAVNPRTPRELDRIIGKAIEKDPDLRYQHAADMCADLKHLKRNMEAGTADFVSSRRVSAWAARLSWRTVGIPLALMIAFGVWWANPLPAPRLLSPFQITESGKYDFAVRPASDGVRIFCVRKAGGHFELVQASVHGGEEHLMTPPFQNTNTVIWDVSADGSRYLVGTFAVRGEPSPLWSWPATGGAPTKLGDLVSGDAAYSPDGLRIAFHLANQLSVANADGTGKRRLGTFSGDVDAPAWLPGGHRIRFTVTTDGKAPSSIWEIDADGSGLRQILPGWNHSAGICCGVWTTDARYYVFVELGASRLWALPQKRQWWRRGSAGPFPLLAFPPNVRSPLAGRDGRHIFFWGNTERHDLQVVDPRTQTLSSFLPGRRASMPGISQEFGQVAYTERGRLWRIRADGEDARPIATPALWVFFPRWSPDGRNLVFTGNDSKGVPHVYTIAVDGGEAQPVLPGEGALRDPDWSQDGSQIVLIRELRGSPWDSVLALVATTARDRFVDIPGSQNLIFPRWSPKGRLLAATSADRREIRLYDFARRSWQVAARGRGLGQVVWSKSGGRLFYQDVRAPGIPVFAFDLRSATTKTVARFDGVLNAGTMACYFSALAPGDLPVMDVQRSLSDLFSAEIDFP